MMIVGAENVFFFQITCNCLLDWIFEYLLVASVLVVGKVAKNKICMFMLYITYTLCSGLFMEYGVKQKIK